MATFFSQAAEAAVATAAAKQQRSRQQQQQDFPRIQIEYKAGEGGTETGTGPVTACIGLQTFFRVSASAAIYVYK